jgi:starch phosphorylase
LLGSHRLQASKPAVADVERLKSIVRDSGPLQVVFAGKAHPRDSSGKEAIKRIFAARKRLAQEIPIVSSKLRSRSPSWSPASTSGSTPPDPPLEASERAA